MLDLFQRYRDLNRRFFARGGQMEKRTLTITLQADWKAALRAAGKAAQRGGYQGEVLNFESPGIFFSRLSEHC